MYQLCVYVGEGESGRYFTEKIVSHTAWDGSDFALVDLVCNFFFFTF